MAKCELCDKGPLSGNHVSHSNVKTKRTFDPNILAETLYSDVLSQSYRAKICRACQRTLTSKGVDDWAVKNKKFWKLGRKTGAKKFMIKIERFIRGASSDDL